VSAFDPLQTLATRRLEQENREGGQWSGLETKETSLTCICYDKMSLEIVHHMRGRARQLRRVADMAHDPRIIEALLKMATEIETDAAKLEQAETERL
jgi:hypothetical protein